MNSQLKKAFKISLREIYLTIIFHILIFLKDTFHP